MGRLLYLNATRGGISLVGLVALCYILWKWRKRRFNAPKRPLVRHIKSHPVILIIMLMAGYNFYQACGKNKNVGVICGIDPVYNSDFICLFLRFTRRASNWY